MSKTVFDFSAKAFDWSPFLVGSLLFAFGYFGVWMEKRKIRGTLIPKIGYILCGVGLLWIVFYVCWIFSSYHEHVSALRGGNYSVVEGVVESFHPMPYEGHSYESFRVRGIRFTYSDYTITPCFNNTASHGGPIREGIRVRVTYRDNCILRLEVVSETPVVAPNPVGGEK